ncbi:beta-1,3-galactosyltransferase 1-like [Lineus longissimus]|uniref:beta-1,3-galactosyltransferase 1-like n=1 Tax=Lineus longissimus TaxID=88925 RepID=UPI00315CE1EC
MAGVPIKGPRSLRPMTDLETSQNVRPLKTADLFNQLENLKTADLLNLLNLKKIDERTANMLHRLTLSEKDEILSPPPCEDDIYLLILMVSSIGNFRRRADVREWLKINPYRGKKIRLAFIVARVYEPKTEAKLRNESSVYNDIIQANYKEAYRNLTFKALAVLKWTVTQCGHAKFLVKIDDDAVMIYQHIVDYVIGLETKNVTMVYQGATYATLEPLRNPKSKWYISHEDFNNDTYAPYASGFFVLLSLEAVQKMYHASFHVSRVYGVTRQTFPVDDAFIGVLARYSNIKLRNLPYVIYSWSHIEKVLKKDKCILVKLIASHGFPKRSNEIVKYLKQLENMTEAEVQTCEKRKNVYPIN